jgi:hypothetical protein
MIWKFALPTALLVLSACATVVDEKRTMAVLERGFNAGERYEIRTRTIQGPNGLYEQTSVVYRGFTRLCRIDSPGDCEKAAEQLIDDYDDSFFF